MSDDIFAVRELCPDGACIGVIGPDGICRECGRVGNSAVSDPRLRNLATEPADDNSEEPGGESASEDFEGRVLCPDGGCIGLVGDDGKCKVCGHLAEPPGA